MPTLPSAATDLQALTLSPQTDVGIPLGLRLDLWNFSVGVVIITLSPVEGQPFNVLLQSGEKVGFSGRSVAKINGGAGAAGVAAFYARETDPFTFCGSGVVQGYDARLQDSQSTLGSVPVEAETVIVSGLSTVALGARILAHVAATPATTAAGGATATYIAIKGHTTGFYYSLAYDGQSHHQESRCIAPAGEKLDIVAANASATALSMSASFVADQPSGG